MCSTSRLILLILLSLTRLGVFATEKEIEPKFYGLKFLSHDVNQDQRTGLNLTADGDLSFPDDGFSMAFDLKLCMEYHTYGYVFKVIANDESSFDLVSNLLQQKVSFILNERKKVVESKGLVDSLLFVNEQWIPVKVTFNKHHIWLKIGNYSTTLAHSFHDFKHIKIYFGLNKHAYYYTADVPPMTIRNIVIQSQGKVIRSWKLAYHNRTEVLDDIKGTRASVINGSWEIDKHAHWEKVASLNLANQQAQVAFDSLGGRIFAVTANNIYTFSIAEKKMDSVRVAKGNPYLGVSRQLIYDQVSKQLISYTHMFPQLDTYNFQTNEWSLSPTRIIDAKQHHNHTIDRQRNKLIMLMGYGYHQYDGTLLERSLDGSGQWKTNVLDPPIAPRYLAALGVEDDNHVLLLGGYGSISGKQEESPRNFYDLYRINLRTGKTAKLWFFSNDSNHFTFSNSMVVDKAKNKLYALAYNNDSYHSKLYLCAFDLVTKHPKPLVVSDSIAYHFLDVKSYCDLFLHAQTSTLYALVSHEKQPGQQMVEIYALAFPPIAEDAIIQVSQNSHYVNIAILMACVLLLLVMSALIIRWRIKRRRAITDTSIEPKTDSSFIQQAIAEHIVPVVTKSKQVQYPSVLLIGGFQVFAKNGENMTAEFTPIVRNIFLMLLFNTLKDQKGTTSQQLDETFWFDMERSKALNNRGVNIRKLRLLLKTLDSIDLMNKNGYWKLQMDHHIFCDYKEIMLLLHEIKQKKIANKEQLAKLVNLATDELLPDISAEWLDRFKSEYQTLLVEILLNVLSQTDIKSDPKLLLKIVDVILVHDCIEEDAIRLKCRILYQTGQKGLSKQTFDKFYADYKRILDAVPHFTYDDIILN
ncbi:hypothetical protein GCM10023231_29530 [Olivibacter ginsenosidimutans]|uniref:Galactose oxidase n=1 Tax=Olivibacter ginsenosidimutans TaxID=1176537 RepID=A0ABP9BQ84_9SPHI